VSVSTQNKNGKPESVHDGGELGTWERLWRFVSVLSLAVRVYVGYKSVQLWSRFISDTKAAERYRRQDLRSARALLRTAIKLEGLLIKACQFIGTRADILPDEWVATLSVLHDRVPPRPFEMIRAQIERELGRPLESIYPSFNPQPIASASLAQVHEARLCDGRRCAVKVQYPGIEARVNADLRNLMFVLRILARLEHNFDFRAVAREMLKYVPMELDFVNEGHNCERIGRNLAARADVTVPKVYWELTSRRVLTMEFMEGVKITELEGTAINRHDVAQKLVEIYCEQILRDGFFQADPHPGNILVQPGPRLVLLDFGLAKDFPPSFREGVVRLTLAVLTGDQAGIVRAFEIGIQDQQRLAGWDGQGVRRADRQRHPARQGLRRPGPDAGDLRRIAARAARQSDRRSAGRYPAGQPRDGPAQRSGQESGLPGRYDADHDALRTDGQWSNPHRGARVNLPKSI